MFHEMPDQESNILQSNTEIVLTPQIIAFTVEKAENDHQVPSPLPRISPNFIITFIKRKS